jgi:hypothetical protein
VVATPERPLLPHATPPYWRAVEGEVNGDDPHSSTSGLYAPVRPTTGRREASRCQHRCEGASATASAPSDRTWPARASRLDARARRRHRGPGGRERVRSWDPRTSRRSSRTCDGGLPLRARPSTYGRRDLPAAPPVGARLVKDERWTVDELLIRAQARRAGWRMSTFAARLSNGGRPPLPVTHPCGSRVGPARRRGKCGGAALARAPGPVRPGNATDVVRRPGPLRADHDAGCRSWALAPWRRRLGPDVRT